MQGNQYLKVFGTSPPVVRTRIHSAIQKETQDIESHHENEAETYESVPYGWLLGSQPISVPPYFVPR